MEENTVNAQPDRPTLLSANLSLGLFNLSGWGGTFFNYWKSNIGSQNQWVLSWYGNVETREVKERIPAYDFSYLLEKAPKSFEHNGSEYFLSLDVSTDGTQWQVDYRDIDDGQYTAEVADTLTEALGRVLGQLIEDGIIPGKAA